jgi:hypothetical protein
MSQSLAPRFNSPFSTAEQEENKIPDWSESLTSLSKATRALEDALPAADEAKTRAAFARLTTAHYDLKRFLIAKQVLPSVSEGADEPTV